MMQERYTRDQKMILVLCMIAYTVLYFMRLNISVAITDLGAELVLDRTQQGAITSAFFWSYAVGQLINGYLGERLPARYMVFVGLLASGILNAVLSFTDSYTVTLFCWGLNGLFQSMLWSPIVKCTALYFSEQQRIIVSFALSITQVLGYMLGWTVSYFMNTSIGWRYVFRVPAVFGIVFAIVWFFLFRYGSREAPVNVRREKGVSLLKRPVLVVFLGILAVYSIVFGLIKSSIDTWLPTMLTDLGKLPDSAILVTLLFVPMLNFAGILLSKMLVKRLKGDIYKSILYLWLGALVVSGVSLILFRVHPIAVVCAVSLLFGLVYGQTPLFTSFIPLDFTKWNCVSTVTGFIDFAIYLGAGITGLVSGAVLGNDYDWLALATYWLIVLAVGMVFASGIYLWHIRLRKVINREELEWD